MTVQILTGTGNATRSTVATSAGNTTITCGRPANVVAGEHMLAIMTNLDIINPSTVPTPPSGWTQLYTNHGLDHFRRRISVYVKQATGSEPADYTWTIGSDPRDDDIQIFRVTGANSSTFSDVTPKSTDTASITNIVCPSITTVTNNALVCYVMAANGSALAAEDANYPTGADGVFLKRTRNHSYGIAYGLATEVKASAGDTGTKTWTGALSTSSNYTGAVTFAIRAAAGTAPTLTDVDTDETVTSTQTGVVFTGTNLGPSQGSSTLKLKYLPLAIAITLSPSAWADTSITANIIRTSGGVSLPYGAITAEVETASGAGTLAITHVPPDARSYVTLTSLATTGRRITAIGLAIGDQIEVTSVTGGSISDVTLNADGTFDCAVSVTSFTVRGWDATDGTLGTEGTQTVASPTSVAPKDNPNEWVLAQSTGQAAVPDAWDAFFDQQLIPAGSWNDRMYVYLVSEGFTGSLSDMMSKWKNS